VKVEPTLAVLAPSFVPPGMMIEVG
jgi:hypothetical protein